MKAELIVDTHMVGRKKIWIKEVHYPHFEHPSHFHQLCELAWIKKGRGKLIVGDYIGDYSEGDLILIAPERPYRFQSTPVHLKEPDRATRAVVIYFPRNLILNITDDPESVRRYQNLMVQAQRSIRFLGSVKAHALRKMTLLRSTTGLSRMGLFLQILDILSEATESECWTSDTYHFSFGGINTKRLKNVYQHLLTNFSGNISLKDVADIAHMSPSAFCRYFKLKTKKTFSQVLKEIRVGNACKLLQDENYSLKEICYLCGYNNPTSFYISFKQVMQMTPSEYRRRCTSLLLLRAQVNGVGQ